MVSWFLQCFSHVTHPTHPTLHTSTCRDLLLFDTCNLSPKGCPAQLQQHTSSPAKPKLPPLPPKLPALVLALALALERHAPVNVFLQPAEPQEKPLA